MKGWPKMGGMGEREKSKLAMMGSIDRKDAIGQVRPFTIPSSEKKTPTRLNTHYDDGGILFIENMNSDNSKSIENQLSSHQKPKPDHTHSLEKFSPFII